LYTFGWENGGGWGGRVFVVKIVVIMVTICFLELVSVIFPRKDVLAVTIQYFFFIHVQNEYGVYSLLLTGLKGKSGQD
jgi:hypothetical protein